MPERRTRSAPLPLVGRGWGWGSLSGPPHDPHPTRFARDPPHKGEGRTECAALKCFEYKRRRPKRTAGNRGSHSETNNVVSKPELWISSAVNSGSPRS